MFFSKLNRQRPGAVLLALAAAPFAWAGGAFAQAAHYPQGAVVQSLAATPADQLAGYLQRVADNPNDLSALLGAGQAALSAGDAEGALALFARAEQLAPRDGHAKAGMGSAFVQSEQPQAALRFFAEAVGLGVPVAEIARDRGLAYDMTGEPRLAQADYALVLKRGSDAEVERRMALSKAIGGDRAGALAVLEPQIRRQDRAGWRARAFVLALTGAPDEAAKVFGTMMPGREAAMRPFFEKLPQLGPAEKAMAVHFGHFPNGAQWASRGAPVRTASVLAPTPAAPPAQARKPAAPAALRTNPPRPQTSAPPAPRPVQTAQAKPASPPPTTTTPPQDRLAFADVADFVRSLPAVELAAERPALTPAKPAAKPAPARKVEAKKSVAPKEPARIWVQLAAGANKAVFPGEYRKMQTKAGKLLAGKTAWTAPLGRSNRLLVGPFETDGQAKELVDGLSKLKMASYSWTSADGQAIEKLPAR